MGKKKLVIIILSPFLLILLLLLIILACPPIVLVIRDIFRGDKGEMTITDISLTENSMVIEVDRKKTIYNFQGAWDLRYRNIPRGFMLYLVRSSELDKYLEAGLLASEPGLLIMEEEWYGEHESKITLTMDLTNIARAVYNENEEPPDRFHTLYINEEAVLNFWLSGGPGESWLRLFLLKKTKYIFWSKVSVLGRECHLLWYLLNNQGDNAVYGSV